VKDPVADTYDEIIHCQLALGDICMYFKESNLTKIKLEGDKCVHSFVCKHKKTFYERQDLFSSC
jgi:hypothetical protein